MAKSDKNESVERDEQFAEQERKDLVGNDNRELEHADHVVNHEPLAAGHTSEIQHRRRVHGAGNRTLQGAPSDVHQALVTLSNMHRNEAAAFDEVSAVLGKYKDADALDELHPDVVAHLEAYRKELEPRAKLYTATRKLLEEHA